MLNKFRRGPFVVTIVTLSLLWSVAAASAAPRMSVIVVFDDAVANPAGLVAQLGRAHGFTARHVYSHALKGFAASVPAGAVAALSAHPQVLTVEPETIERLAVQTLPTGADRIEVDKNPAAGVGVDGPTIDIDIAILDTGINSHPDLNLAGGYSATPDGIWSDPSGHGTHVAGIVAARDNDFGVVGVAPGARVWSVRVCRREGTSDACYSSDVVAGIDWVVARKNDFKNGVSGGINFAAANYSITSPDTTSSCNAQNKGVNANHSAICRLVSSGVLFAMAAGNNARLKNAYPEAFTVAAVTDFDGKAGGFGQPTCRWDTDDQLAHFSNWGVDIAAPGSCILSTANDGGYVVYSGTSMATPYVAGAVALYLHANSKAPATNKAGVVAIENAIVSAALAQSHACGYVNHRGTDEKLLFVNDVAHFKGTGECEVADPPPPPNGPPVVSISTPADGAVFEADDAISFSGSAFDAEDGDLTDELVWTSSLDGEIGTGAGFSATLAEGTHTITAAVTDSGDLESSASVSITVTGAEPPPPPPPPPPDNAPPVVTISSPSNGATYSTADTISFSGSASDDEDGDLAHALVWTSSLQGQIGTGAGFSATLVAGAHTISAAVTDSGGLTDSASVSVTVNAPPPPPPPPSTTMSASLNGASGNNGNTWTATAIALVSDGNGNPLSGATVTATWTVNGATESAGCSTASDGTCSMTRSGILKRVNSASLEVSAVVRDGYTYSGGYPSITIGKS